MSMANLRTFNARRDLRKGETGEGHGITMWTYGPNDSLRKLITLLGDEIYIPQRKSKVKAPGFQTIDIRADNPGLIGTRAMTGAYLLPEGSRKPELNVGDVVAETAGAWFVVVRTGLLLMPDDAQNGRLTHEIDLNRLILQGAQLTGHGGFSLGGCRSLISAEPRFDLPDAEAKRLWSAVRRETIRGTEFALYRHDLIELPKKGKPEYLTQDVDGSLARLVGMPDKVLIADAPATEGYGQVWLDLEANRLDRNRLERERRREAKQAAVHAASDATEGNQGQG